MLLGLFAMEGPFADKEQAQKSIALKHYLMGSIYSRRGETDKAIEAYRKAIAVDTDTALLHSKLAVEYLKIKPEDTTEAIAELKKAIELDPQAIEPHLILALIYSYKEDDASANQEFESALINAQKLNPDNPAVPKGLAEIYIQQGRLDEAINAYKTALALAPQDEETHFYLGTIYYSQKRLIEAIAAFKTAIKIKPDYAEALNSLAYLYAEQGANLAEAERLVKRALAVDPENGAYVDTLGWIYFKEQKVEAARIELERASKLTQDPVVYDHLGDVYLKQGLVNQARQMWQESMKLDAEQKDVQKKLDRYPAKK